MKLTDQSFVNTIKRLVAENPDFKYKRRDTGYWYLYVEKNDAGELVGSCLLGRALVSLGVDAHELHNFEGSEFDDLAKKLELPLSPSIVNWGNSLQDLQDSGQPWGKLFDLVKLPTGPLFKEPETLE